MAEQYTLPPETAAILERARETLRSILPVNVVDDDTATLAGVLVYTLSTIQQTLRGEQRRLCDPYLAAIGQVRQALSADQFAQEELRLRQQLFEYSDGKARARQAARARR